VLAHCQFILGPEVAELETELARFCGARHCVAVSSGTDAIQIALMAEGIGPGDAVFLPAFTYTATAEVPLVLSATPVFVDVDPRTFQIDPAHLEQRIATVRRGKKLRPRALIGVDLFGQPADWPALQSIARDQDLFTLDDLAQSFGCSLHGKLLGSAADATATSFFPSKPFGAYGDGGALFTENDERAELYRSLRTHGEGGSRYEVLHTGMNGRLDSLQAAVLLAKLTVFPEEVSIRQRIAQYYDGRLGNAVITPARVPDSTSVWAIYSVLLADAATRDAVQASLRADGVPTAIYYPRPLHRQPAYRDYHDGADLPVSDDLASRILALPIHPDLSEADMARVCDALLRALG
jgi:dTDP-4-amino-4,6-dideoxygalactose transaminase